MSTSEEYAEYLDDPGKDLAMKMAANSDINLTILVKSDGTISVMNHTGMPIQNVSNGGPQPEVPPDCQFRAGVVVFSRNPTCVRCLHGGQWREICW